MNRLSLFHGALLLVGILVAACPAIADDRGSDSPYALLKLPPQRAARLKELQAGVDSASVKLKERLGTLWAELEALYRSYRYDEERGRWLQREIQETHGAMVELHRHFQVRLRDILTEAEFERLQSILQKARGIKENPRRLSWELEHARKRIAELESEQEKLGALGRSEELAALQRELRAARGRAADLEKQLRSIRANDKVTR